MICGFGPMIYRISQKLWKINCWKDAYSATLASAPNDFPRFHPLRITSKTYAYKWLSFLDFYRNVFDPKLIVGESVFSSEDFSASEFLSI